MITVGEDPRGSKQQMDLLGSNSKSRTASSVFPLSHHWENGALRATAKVLSLGWGLRREANLSTFGLEMRYE